MKSGYTLAELKEMEAAKAVRRSHFRKCRRLHRQLLLKQWWPLYKKLRRAATQELEAVGLQADDSTIDQHLAKALPDICRELEHLFRADVECRKKIVELADAA